MEKTPLERGLEGALLLKDIQLLEMQKKYWYEAYCRAGENLEHTKAELERAKAKSRGELT